MHRIILAPKILIYHFFCPSFKLFFKIIVVLCLRPAQSIRCSFTNILARQEAVGSIRQPSDYGSGEKYRPEFIYCVDGQQPKIHEVLTFREDGVTPEVHPTARVYVGDFVGGCFATDYLTPI